MGNLPHIVAQHAHARAHIIERGVHGLVESGECGIFRQNGVGRILPLGLGVQVAGEVAGIVSIDRERSHALLDCPMAHLVPKKFKVVVMDIHVVDHPLAASRLTLMRDARSDNSAFRAALKDLGAMLVYEASRDLAVENFDCATPVSTAQGTRLQDPPIIVPIIRAGLGMVDPALSMIPDAQVGFIGMARNEETHEPVPYLEALPEDLTGRTVFVVDPMLATGGSLLHALRLLADRGATDITAICMVSAQPGVDALADSDLPVRLVTAAIDPSLNEDAYIVPGLGDAGDRLYGPRNIDL